MAQIINNPDVPHLSSINNGLTSGKLIRIQGTAAPTAQRFNVNLQCGPNVSPRDDIALHLSVRVVDGVVGRNTLERQIWGEEQGQGYNPIGAGQQFEILILTDQTSYKIAINGKHFCEFPHRIPFSRVSHLTIDGDVSLRLISYEMGGPPGPPPSTPSAPMYSSQGGPPMYGPPTGQPFSGPPGAYGPGPYGPPPPGYHPEGDKSGSGLEGFLSQAGTAIAGAFGTAVLQGALSGKQQPNAATHGPTQSAAGGLAGQPVGGLGSIGSFLTSTLANTVLKPSRKLSKKQHKAEKKAAKKALKYGVPAVGIGFGAYALHKGFKHKKHKHHHFGHRSSSSSSSSSSD